MAPAVLHTKRSTLLGRGIAETSACAPGGNCTRRSASTTRAACSASPRPTASGGPSRVTRVVAIHAAAPSTAIASVPRHNHGVTSLAARFPDGRGSSGGKAAAGVQSRFQKPAGSSAVAPVRHRRQSTIHNGRKASSTTAPRSSQMPDDVAANSGSAISTMS